MSRRLSVVGALLVLLVMVVATAALARDKIKVELASGVFQTGCDESSGAPDGVVGYQGEYELHSGGQIIGYAVICSEPTGLGRESNYGHWHLNNDDDYVASVTSSQFVEKPNKLEVTIEGSVFGGTGVFAGNTGDISGSASSKDGSPLDIKVVITLN